jgi:hypothetical protein
MILSRRAVYDLAVLVGLAPEQAIDAVAVSEAESGRNTDNRADQSLVDDTWGPSLGLWQIRSLKTDKGTGRVRDGDRLLDPTFNARSMAAISGLGFSWQPWTVWRNGTATALLPAIRAEIEGGEMELWHPRATRVEPTDGHNGGSFIGVPFKIVLHTVEGYSYSPNRTSYYGNPFWPHSTISSDGIFQHLPINVSAYALYHGDVATNTANAIQCEITWYANDAPNIPNTILTHVSDWIGWVAEQTSTPLNFAQFVAYPASAGEGAAQRFGAQEWLRFNGVCGHEHVPSGNDHGDPGLFPIDRLNLEDDVALTPQEHDTLIFIGQVLNDIKRGIETGSGKPIWDAVADIVKKK